MGLEDIKRTIELSAYAFVGWLVSWIIFFIMLPITAHFIGKARAVTLCYALTWPIMIAIILGLEYATRNGLIKDNSVVIAVDRYE
jgi:hypothetical protein